MADRARETGSDSKAQLAAFRKAARQLGCDETEDRFKEALRTVAKAKPTNKDIAEKKRDGG